MIDYNTQMLCVKFVWQKNVWVNCEENAERISRSVRQYLLANPDEARKFVNVLTVEEVPQDVIDSYIMQYVPDTISFSMVQKMMKQKGK